MKVELDNKNEALLCFLFFLPQMNYYVAAILSSYGIQTITPFVYFFLILTGIYSVLRNLRYRKCFLWSFGMIVVLLLSLIVNWNVTEYMITDSHSLFSSPVIMLCTIYFPIF